jgi:hypothetical protein
MQIIALEKELTGANSHDFEPHLLAEAARAWELYQSGLIRQIYFRQDWPGAVLILECSSIAEAETALETLPLVQQGLIAFDFIPLKPYPGFARLFGSDWPLESRTP